MAKGDLNHDGLEDIIIGSTNVLPTKVYLQTANGFKDTIIKGLTEPETFSESDFAILDVDGDGDNDVIALAGGYEEAADRYIHYLYRNNKGSFQRTPLPIPPFPASVVRACDFDHDGDMDLFIGARIKKDQYPLADDSWLLINDHGKFTRES